MSIPWFYTPLDVLEETPRRRTAGGGNIKSDGLAKAIRKTLCATNDPFEGDEDFGGFVPGFPLIVLVMKV